MIQTAIKPFAPETSIFDGGRIAVILVVIGESPLVQDWETSVNQTAGDWLSPFM